MSAESDGDRIAESEAIVDSLHRWYHIPVLSAVFAFMLWTRTQAYDRFVRDGDVFFSGNDAYYHYRATSYSVNNWPRRLFGEPWTQFPYGQNVGHFGTLFDQVVGTVALVVGLGDPSSRQVAVIAVVAPAVIAALIAIPVYFLAKRLSGSRLGGVTAAVVLGLIPQGTWVRRGTVGFYDHHMPEALTMAIAVFAMVYALMVVRRERPVFEQVQDRDWDGLKPTLKAGAIAGIAMAIYLLTWPAGVVLVGIVGVFFVLAMTHAVVTGRSPEHLAFVGAISLGVAFLVLLPWVQSLSAATTTLSSLQILAIGAVAGGCAFMGGLARYWESEGLEAWGYPAVVGVLSLAGVGVLWLVLPEVITSVWNNMQRIFFLGQSDTALTISEAQSMFGDGRDPVSEQFYNGYGFTFYTAMVAAGWMGARAVLAQRIREEYLLVVVWTVFLLLMTLTQVRFHYYLVLPVAVLNGWAVVQIARLAEFPSLAEFKQIQTYHVLTIAAVVMLLVVPIAGPLAVATASENAQRTGPGSVTVWDENLEWMSENTPQPGEYGGENNAMSYYGPFDDIDDYEYPDGAYGVMSWWDYGHWITVEGERIPNANPFQSGAREASAYLQADNETRANLYLDALPADPPASLDNMTDAELQAAIDSRSDQEAAEETRYVMIDDQMVGGKFAAITEWAGADYSDYFDSQRFQIGNQNSTLPVTNQRFRETMIGRLYEQDAATLEHYRLVDEADSYSIVGGYAQQGGGVRPRTALRLQGGWDAVQNTSRQLRQASFFGQAVPISSSEYVFDASVESSVKTYERVEGATITGEVEANRTVQALVELETDHGRTFNYRQTTTAGEDGSFELTVPYATTNELGPDDGYTNTSVEANGGYTVRSIHNRSVSANATDVSVPEPAIYDGETIEVDLDPVEQAASDGNDSVTVGSVARPEIAG